MQWSLFLLSLLRVLHFTHTTSSEQCPPHSRQPRVYHFVKNQKNWSDAQKYCRNKFTDLATIDNEEDMKTLTGCGERNGYEEAWIGLKKEGRSEWHWSLPESEYTECKDFWNKGEPNNKGGKENCVRMLKTGCWQDHGCETKSGFICYNSSGQDATSKFHFVKEEKTWRAAQSHCRGQHTDLAAVRNRSENEEIKNMIPSSVQRVWIGLSLFRDGWKWSDGSDSSSRFWSMEFRNIEGDRCAVMKLCKQGKWMDERCDKEKSFLCLDDELILISKNMSWKEALEYCRENHHDLVSVHNADIQQRVQQKAKMADTPYVWLGLRYTCTLDYWFWVSGQSACFQNWAPGNGAGGEECGMTGAVQKGGDRLWVSRPDVEKLNFICIK